MNLKKFVQPTKFKIFIFFLIPGLLISHVYGMFPPEYKGFSFDVYPVIYNDGDGIYSFSASPMIFYIPTVFYSLLQGNTKPMGAHPTIYFNGSALSPIITICASIASVIFAYLISCLIVHLINKQKKNKNFKDSAV